MQNQLFDWWSVVIILGIVQGLIVAVALLFNHRGKPALFMLAILVVILVWHHLQSISIYLGFYKNFPHFYGADLGSLFLIGPLFYLYIKLVTSENSQKLNKWSWLHFSPFLVTIVAHPVIFLSTESKIELISDWLVATRYNNPHLRQAFLLDDVIFILESISMIVYFAMAINLLKRYDRRIKDYVSNLHKMHVQWLTIISISMIAVITGSFILQKTLYIQLKYYYYSLDYIYILPMTLFIYFIGFYALKSPHLFTHELDFSKLSSKYSRSSLTDKQAVEFYQRIENHLNFKKPFLNPDLTLPELASGLEIPSNHLSQVINEKFGLSFFDLINQYRVEEAIRRLKNEDHQKDKLLKIALESGFNNKVSFNRYFKKITGKTPSSYRKKIQKLS